ncbi:MAG: tetratricopeptide repeat protein [Bacteroidia bacterium]|nr:tetratricopeptide repeat protein [Bacteroidia bacterium]
MSSLQKAPKLFFNDFLPLTKRSDLTQVIPEGKSLKNSHPLGLGQKLVVDNRLFGVRSIIIGIFISIITLPFVFAESKTDSLQQLLNDAATDTAKINILNKMCSELTGINNKNALKYGEQAKALSEKISYDKGLAQSFFNIGSVYKDIGEYNKSLEFNLKSMELREALKDKKDIAESLVNTGLVYKELNSFEKSLEYLSKAQALAEKIHDLNSMANACNGLGSLYLKFKNYNQALIHYMKSLDIRESLGVKKDIATTLNNLGMVNKEYSNFPLAIEYYKKSLSISKTIHDQKNIANTLNLMGGTSWDMKQYGDAIEYYMESLKIREEIGNKKDIASSFNNIGNVFKNVNNNIKALEYYQKALEIRRELKDETHTAQTLNDIGSIYWKMKKYDPALKYYKDALKIRRNTGDKISIAQSLKNIGIVYKELHMYESALDSYRKALSIFEDVGDNKNISHVSNYMGKTYMELKEYKKAEQFFFKSLSISERGYFKEGIASSALNLGELYIKAHRMKDAIKYYELALSIAKVTNQKDILVKVYDTLEDLYADQSDYKKAWIYNKLYSMVKDGIVEDEGNIKIADVQVKMVTYKKEKEIDEKQKELKYRESELKKEKLIRYFLIGGFIGILIILTLVYMQYKIKKRSNKLLAMQKKEIEKQAVALEFANNELTVKNTQITDSITYAKLIQDAILLPEKNIRNYLPESFIFYKPRDIVSGDFYWLFQEDNKIFFAVADCTGHGVPGGFMSMIGYTLLNTIVKEKKVFNPSKILDKLNAGVYLTLNQNESKQDDGMDITICCIDTDAKQVHIALANQAAFIVQEGEMITIKGDIYSIGGIFSSRTKVDFVTHTFDIKNDTMLYMFTDGMMDQIGEEENTVPAGRQEKFGITQFENLLYKSHNLPICAQYDAIHSAFLNWKGSKRQIDDILIVGIKLG